MKILKSIGFGIVVSSLASTAGVAAVMAVRWASMNYGDDACALATSFIVLAVLFSFARYMAMK